MLRRLSQAHLCILSIAAAVVIGFGAAAYGQPSGGGSSGRTAGGGNKGGPTPPPPKEPKDNGPTGTDSGFVSKIDPPKDGEGEDSLGTLSIQWPVKNPKTRKFRLKRGDKSLLEAPGHSFDNEVLTDILRKGLYCTVEWKKEKSEDPKKKPKGPPDVVVIKVNGFDVEGTIKEIKDDYVILQARPKSGAAWPDDDTKQFVAPPPKPGGKGGNKGGAPGMGGGGGHAPPKPPKTPPTPPKPKPEKAKTVRLRIIEDLTKFVDAEKKPLELGDFAAGQKIEAVIVFGKHEGMMVEMRATSAKSDDIAGGSKRGSDEGGGTKGGRSGH